MFIHLSESKAAVSRLNEDQKAEGKRGGQRRGGRALERAGRHTWSIRTEVQGGESTGSPVGHTHARTHAGSWQGRNSCPLW